MYYRTNEEKMQTKKPAEPKFCWFSLCLFPLDMSIDTVLYKWHKTKVFIIGFSLIIHFISVYLTFCKHETIPYFSNETSVKFLLYL